MEEDGEREGIAAVWDSFPSTIAAASEDSGLGEGQVGRFQNERGEERRKYVSKRTVSIDSLSSLSIPGLR